MRFEAFWAALLKAGNGKRGYFGTSLPPRVRKASQTVEATRAPLRIFWNQEDFVAPEAGGLRRQAVTPATSNAAAEAHALMVLTRWVRS